MVLIYLFKNPVKLLGPPPLLTQPLHTGCFSFSCNLLEKKLKRLIGPKYLHTE